MLEHDGANKPVYLATQEADSLSDDLPGEETPVISPADTLPAKNDSQYSEDEDRIVLNVGGVRHETHLTTLRKIEHTRLSRLAEQHEFSDSQKEVYFFDRHPAVFNSIIDFYRSGELHVPLEVCGAVVKREFDYWMIQENNIKSCCWSNYRTYIENQRILEAFNTSVLTDVKIPDTDGLVGWNKYRTKIWYILEYPGSSRTALGFGILSLLFVILSILGFCLETLPDLRPQNVSLGANNTGTCQGKNITVNYVLKPNEGLNILDIICTTYFTCELITRFVCSPNKFRFVTSMMNIIDLLALVPLYMQLILNSEPFKYCYMNERLIFEIMFILRIIRMFRIFHLVKHYQALQILVYAIKASTQELLMLLIFLLLGMLVFATMIYYAERSGIENSDTQIPTIPIGFWWAIITMTTVGYGDIAPSTPFGYVVGTFCAISGVLMVALTIPVISNNFTLFYTHVRTRGSGDEEEDVAVENMLHSEEISNVYENARRTSNGSIVVSEKDFSRKEKGSDISTLCAAPYTNSKCGHNGDIRYGQMLYDTDIKHKTSRSLIDVGHTHEDEDYFIENEGAVKAYSDDGVIYTGELHVPLEVCGAVVKRELDYWQIMETNIKSCCWRNYRTYIENQRILEAFNHSVLSDQRKKVDTDSLTGWEKYRTKMWLFLEYPRTSRAALIFGIISLMFVVLSILGFCLETLPDLRPVNVSLDANSTGKCESKNITVNYVLKPNEVLSILDVICTTFFTAELIVRFIFSPDKLKFIRNAMNIIDLLALVPLYMQVILNTEAFKFCYMNERLIFEIMFILRIIRMFRIFHLVKHYQALQILVYAIKASIQELLMLLIFLLIGMLVFATMIYYAEREDAFNQGTQFSTIPIGFWWSIITMTTVGYGDIAPSTPLGYVVGTCCSICGVLMVALTIPVISNNFTLFYTHVRSRGGRRSSSEGLDQTLFMTNEDDVKSYKSVKRTSNGSILNEVHFSRKRKVSDMTTLAVNSNRFKTYGHNGDVRYGLMTNSAEDRHKLSSSMIDIGKKDEGVAYYIANAGFLKAYSDDGVIYSGSKE